MASPNGNLAQSDEEFEMIGMLIFLAIICFIQPIEII